MYVHCPECGGVVEVVNSLADSLVRCSHCEKRFDPREKETLPPTGRAQNPELLPGLRAGDRLGGYVLQRVLGRGGMGTVIEATQLSLGRQVAIKVLASDLARDPQFVQRFDAEARLLAALDHPNLVRVIDKGIEKGHLYLVMEKIDGVSLRDLLNERRLPSGDALKIIPPLCDALEYAHSQGVVHRDIKPENILVARDGTPKIADFGLARLVDTPEVRRITQSNMIMGTLDYMAPEQRERTKDADHRADIYALGVVLYEMLTGELPLGRFDPPSKKVELEIDLDDVILRVLSKDPGARYQHASDMGDAIRSRVSAQRRGEAAPRAPRAGALFNGVFGASGLAPRTFGFILCAAALLFAVLLAAQALQTGVLVRHDLQKSNAFSAGLVGGLGILSALWFGLLPRPRWPASWRRRKPGRFGVPKPAWRLVPIVVLGWIFLPFPLGHFLLGLALVTALAIWSESLRFFELSRVDDQPADADAPAKPQPQKKEEEMEIRIKDGRGETQATLEIDADRRGRGGRRKERRAKRRWWSRRRAPAAPEAVEVIAAEPAAEAAKPDRRRLSWMALLGFLASLAAALGATGLLAVEFFLRSDGYQLLDNVVRNDPFGLAAVVAGGNPTAVYGVAFWCLFGALAALALLALWNLLAFGHAAKARGRRGRGLAVLALLLTVAAGLEVGRLAESQTAREVAGWRQRQTAPVAQLRRKEGRVDFPSNPDWGELAIDAWGSWARRTRLSDLFDANLLARRNTDDATDWLVRGTLVRRPLASRAASVAALGEQLRRLHAVGDGTRTGADRADAARKARIEAALGKAAALDPTPAIRKLAKAALEAGKTGHWSWQLAYGLSRGVTVEPDGTPWTVGTDGVVRTLESVDALEQRVTLDLRDASLRDAADAILKQAVGLSFVVSPRVGRLATGRLRLQSVPLRTALDTLCAQVPARWTLKDGVVRITLDFSRGALHKAPSRTPEKPLPREVR